MNKDMTQSAKIQDLIQKGREAELLVKDEQRILCILTDSLNSIKMAIIRERWGASIGTRVVYRNYEYIIAQIQIQNRDVGDLAIRKPWAMGHRIKKDGKLSDQAFHIYDEWTPVEAKEG
jgi:hypothetical protein